MSSDPMELRGLQTAIAVAVVTTVVVIWTVVKRRAKPVALDPKKEIAFALIEKTELSHDTKRLRFALQSDKHVLGLPVGRHIQVSARINGKKILRPYTPTSLDSNVGYFDLVVKVYRPGVHPDFPEGGKLTPHLDKLALGDTIDVRGPSGKISYLGKGKIHVERGKMKESEYIRRESETIGAKKICMIAGGTGITPMYQILQSASLDPKDNTEFFLLFANQDKSSILLHEELEGLAKNRNNVSIWYTVDKAEDGWEYSEGYITKDMLQAHLPPADGNTVVLLCGPPPMIKFSCLANLRELGFSDAQMLEF